MLATPAERQLVAELAAVPNGARILNVGAGRSVSIEQQLAARGRIFVADRVDVDDPTVIHDRVGRCWTAPVESMPMIPDGVYDAAWANYVFEHVHDLDAAAREVRRVLKQGAVFVATVPNPAAPEMRVAAMTPLWIHRLIRGQEAWPTVYAFRTPDELADRFATHGFRPCRVCRFAFVTGYVERIPAVRHIAHGYDSVVGQLGLHRLMGNACVVWEAV